MNPVIERFWLTLLGMVRASLCHSGLELKYWTFAEQYSVGMYNRIPASNPPHHIPIEKYLGKPMAPAVRQLLMKLPPFGTTAFVHMPNGKLDPKARQGIYLGMNMKNASAIVYFPDTQSIVQSNNVKYGQLIYPPKVPNEGHQLTAMLDLIRAMGFDTPIDRSGSSTTDRSIGVLQPAPAPAAVPVPAPAVPAALPAPVLMPIVDEDGEDPLLNVVWQTYPEIHQKEALEDIHVLAALLMSQYDEPRTVTQARASPLRDRWETAMRGEIQKLVDFTAIEIVQFSSVPIGTLIMISHFVFKIKPTIEGMIKETKARLVCSGDRQVLNVHDQADGIASPVVAMAACRVLAAGSAAMHWHCMVIDVASAFMQSDPLEDIIYMWLPKGYYIGDDGKSNLVRLVAAVNGIKQGPHVFYTTVHATLTGQQFKMICCATDPCVFYVDLGLPTQLKLSLVVDDLIVWAQQRSTLLEFKDKFNKRFKLSKADELGMEPMLVLGLFWSYDREAGTLTMTQPEYIKRCLNKFGMADCKPSPIPMATDVDLYLNFDTLSPLTKPNLAIYQSMVGCLIYISNAYRPDILLSTNSMAKFMTIGANSHHLMLVKKIFRYLQGTKTLGLTFTKPQDPANINKIQLWCDAQHLGDSSTHAKRSVKSVGGFVIMMNGASVWSRSFRLALVTMSSTESELVTLSEGAKGVAFIRYLCEAIGFQQQPAIEAFEDNQSCIAIASSPLVSQRTKHLDQRYHFARELVLKKQLLVIYCPTADMIADMLTKPLAQVALERFRDMVLGTRRVALPPIPVQTKSTKQPRKEESRSIDVPND